jgi:3-isopropylmalate dehydrogenase
MLLDHLGEEKAAAEVEAAVAADLVARGSSVRSTSAIGDALAERVTG